MQSKKIPHVGDPAAPDSVEMTAETIDFVNESNAKRKAEGRPVPASICLVCCGCFGVLCEDGSIAFFNPTVGVPTARVFHDVEELNIVARKLGWMATEEDNHRCPACYVKWYKLTEQAREGERVGCLMPASAVRR